MLDLQADPGSEQPFTDTENKIRRAQLRAALDTALDQIPARQAQVIRYRYYQEYTQKQIANAIGTSKTRIGQLEELAISSLRVRTVSDPLEAFVERHTPYHLHVGIEKFRRTQTSAVEKIVLIREQLRERHHPNSTRGVHHDHKRTIVPVSGSTE